MTTTTTTRRGTAGDSSADATAGVRPVLSAQRLEAENVVKNYMLVSLGVGLIPVPAFDLAAFMGANVLMVRRICKAYDIPFKGNRVRSAIASIAGTIGAAGTAGWLGFSMSKLIPGVGTAVGAVALPVMGAALSYVIGKLFIAHFEAGGTLLDFNAGAHAEHVKVLYAEGRDKAAAMMARKKDGAGEAASAS